MYQFYFEKLEVWQNARGLVKETYFTTQSFPDNEKFGMTNKIRRTSTSITANIAKGFLRKSKNDMTFLNDEKHNSLREKSEFISNQINSLYKLIKNHNIIFTVIPINNFTI